MREIRTSGSTRGGALRSPPTLPVQKAFADSITFTEPRPSGSGLQKRMPPGTPKTSCRVIREYFRRAVRLACARLAIASVVGQVNRDCITRNFYENRTTRLVSMFPIEMEAAEPFGIESRALRYDLVNRSLRPGLNGLPVLQKDDTDGRRLESGR